MKVCFVIMGFGKKTDYATGRTLDLDQTYKHIIQPAVKNAGYECIRADEIQDSGLIDKSMYTMLVHADLVIADISTYNPNAIYELGIRHAVRPYSTIILKEKNGKIPFDLDHNRIFMYSHLETDIGADEAIRCQESLKNLIKSIEGKSEVDSPFYSFVHVDPPKISNDEMQKIIQELADSNDHVFAVVENAKTLMSENNFEDACKYWDKAKKIVPTEAYFTQQLALCKYKSELPSKSVALTDALKIIEELDPDINNDPETLGITGAIYKNLYTENSDVEYLNRAIKYYGKGFKVGNDYYTGENYALCLNMKSNIEKNESDEKIYLKMEAKKTREQIVQDLETIIEMGEINELPDKKWVYATLSNCYLALGNDEKSKEFEELFIKEAKINWELKTFFKSAKQIKELKEQKNGEKL